MKYSYYFSIFLIENNIKKQDKSEIFCINMKDTIHTSDTVLDIALFELSCLEALALAPHLAWNILQ